MTVSYASAEELLKELMDLHWALQKRLNEDQNWRKLNANFGLQNETTQLLLGACEKLLAAKEAMERASFEEHTSDLLYVCKHFGTSLDAGLSERAHREKHAAQRPPGGRRRGRQQSQRLLALCWQQEFPPSKDWWANASKRLTPSFQVLRAGRLAVSSPEELVPGDMVYLHAGQRVAVDGRVVVYAEGTTVDVSQLALDSSDVRTVSAKPTGDVITSSCNMVFKDSYIVSGSLFCLAVRAVMNSIVRNCLEEIDDTGDQFTVDVKLPHGMAMSHCRNTFKALCVQAHLACRSFQALSQFGRAGALVVLLTQDLLDAAPALCASARRLGRVLMLVDCGCTRATMVELAQGAGLELVDAASAAGAAQGDLAWREFPVSDEQARLASLVQRVSGPGASGRAGAVLTNVSPPGLAGLCCCLTGAGLRPLYAMGGFSYPESFKALVLTPQMQRRFEGGAPNTAGDPSLDGQGIWVPPKPAVCAMPSAVSSLDEASSRQDSKPWGYVRSLNSSASAMGSSTCISMTTKEDPFAAPLQDFPDRHIELLVSLNSIGVVSKNAEVVLLKQDLAVLGQAWELAARAIPPGCAVPTEA